MRVTPTKETTERELAATELRKRGLVGFVPTGNKGFGCAFEYNPEKMLAMVLASERGESEPPPGAYVLDFDDKP